MSRGLTASSECGQFRRTANTSIFGSGETLGLRQIHSKGPITHSQDLVPFYMDESFKAAVDLKAA